MIIRYTLRAVPTSVLVASGSTGGGGEVSAVAEEQTRIVAAGYIACILAALDGSDAVDPHVDSTRAMDGRRGGSCGSAQQQRFCRLTVDDFVTLM